MYRIFIAHIIVLILANPLFSVTFGHLPQQLSAHFIAKEQKLDVIKNKLKMNGFNILATTKILKKYNIITITNQELQSTNSYMATLQVNVNDKEIRVQNPSYLAAAYLKETYTYGQFKKTINALEDALGPLQESIQKADFSTLANYRFMYGLPKKEDTLFIKKHDNLLESISSRNAKKYIAYTLTLPNGSILVGHKLRGKTNRFLKILGEEQNSQILPYEAIIQGDEVRIMSPKYYLALSLPLLSLHKFMQIAAVPDKIYRNIKKAYQ